MRTRTTKYCQNIGVRHLRDKNSPSKCYCTECYNEIKTRLETIERQGGPVAGLRAVRTLVGGSFGYARSKDEKKLQLSAFFHYVMPHIPSAKADVLIRDIVNNGSQTSDFCTNNGIVKVKMINY